MLRTLSVSIALVLSLMPAMTSGAPAAKRHIHHWHGYGFLPGYHQPPNDTVPIYGARGAVTGEPDYSPQYFGYDGAWHYFGRPGFYRGRYMAAALARAGAGRRSGRPGIAGSKLQA